MSDVLYTYGTTDQITFDDAIALFAPQIASNNDAIGFLYTPKNFWLVKLNSDGTMINPSKKWSLNSCLSSTYEARIFNTELELRWLHKENSKGQVALISEKPIKFTKNEAIEIERRYFISTIEQRYLLWGKATGKNINVGWSQLASSQIGTLDIPVAQVQEYAQLLTKEYLQKQPHHGNVVVMEERLVGLAAGNEVLESK